MKTKYNENLVSWLLYHREIQSILPVGGFTDGEHVTQAVASAQCQWNDDQDDVEQLVPSEVPQLFEDDI